VLLSVEEESWVVVEVELAHHAIAGHIDPQLDTLSHGIYDSSLIPSLQTALPAVPLDLLSRLVYRRPSLLCIANAFTGRLLDTCRSYGFDLAVFEPYHSATGVWALHATAVPSYLRPRSRAERYFVTRARPLYDKQPLLLPGHFPSWTGSAQVLCGTGSIVCQIISSNPRFLNFPATAVPPVGPLYLTIVDPQRQLLRLETE
jgi:hypothetical protein